jgi:hypothetical protein
MACMSIVPGMVFMPAVFCVIVVHITHLYGFVFIVLCCHSFMYSLNSRI